MASTAASTWEKNLLQARMTISLSMLIITSQILALREARLYDPDPAPFVNDFQDGNKR